MRCSTTGVVAVQRSVTTKATEEFVHEQYDEDETLRLVLFAIEDLDHSLERI